MIELEWNSTSIVDDYDEPDRFLYPYYGDIFYIEDDNYRKPIGKFSAYLIDVFNAASEGENIFDVLDSHSSSMSEYFEPIFGDNSPDFSDEVECISDGYADGLNLLIIDRIEILPKFRGKRVGLKVIRHIMNRFSAGAGIIALKAFPLQFEHTGSPIVQAPAAILTPKAPNSLPFQFDNPNPMYKEDDVWRKSLCLDSFVLDISKSTAKLKKYYGRLGFKSLPNSDFMVFPTGRHIPKIPKVSRKKTND